VQTDCTEGQCSRLAAERVCASRLHLCNQVAQTDRAREMLSRGICPFAGDRRLLLHGSVSTSPFDRRFSLEKIPPRLKALSNDALRSKPRKHALGSERQDTDPSRRSLSSLLNPSARRTSLCTEPWRSWLRCAHRVLEICYPSPRIPDEAFVHRRSLPLYEFFAGIENGDLPNEHERRSDLWPLVAVKVLIGIPL